MTAPLTEDRTSAGKPPRQRPSQRQEIAAALVTVVLAAGVIAWIISPHRDTDSTMRNGQRIAVSNGLVGFGSTRSAWNATYGGDPNYIIAGNYGRLIVMYTRLFPDRPTEAQALRELAIEDFPRDATITRTQPRTVCRQFVYASAQLERDAPSIGARFSVTLYSSQTDINAPYTSRHIAEAIISEVADLSGGC